MKWAILEDKVLFSRALAPLDSDRDLRPEDAMVAGLAVPMGYGKGGVWNLLEKANTIIERSSMMPKMELAAKLATVDKDLYGMLGNLKEAREKGWTRRTFEAAQVICQMESDGSLPSEDCERNGILACPCILRVGKEDRDIICMGS
jgi:hypothetical protein